MKDSDLFKKLSFKASSEKDSFALNWRDQLQQIRLAESLSEVALSERDDLDLDLLFAAREKKEEKPPQLFCLWEGGATLQFYEKLKEEGVFEPIVHLSILQVHSETHYGASDLAWIQVLKPRFSEATGRIHLLPQDHKEILRALCLERRLFYWEPLSDSTSRFVYFQWQEAQTESSLPHFRLALRKQKATWKGWGYFYTSPDGGEASSYLDLWEVQTLLKGGVMRSHSVWQPYSLSNTKWYFLISCLLTEGSFSVDESELGEFFQAVLCFLGLEALKDFDLPVGFNVDLLPLSPQPLLYLKTAEKKRSAIQAFVWFRYEGLEYLHEQHQKLKEDRKLPSAPEVFKSQVQQTEASVTLLLWSRNRDQEARSLEDLQKGEGCFWDPFRVSFQVNLDLLLDSIYTWFQGSWEVWAENLRIKVWTDIQVQIQSQVDWFEFRLSLHQERISIQQLLHWLKRKTLFIQLGDGSIGVLPEAWYHELKCLFSLGKEGKESMNFSFANAMHFGECERLAGDHFQGDAFFSSLRADLKNLQGLSPLKAPPSFQKKLRSYQEYGLSWLTFLGKTRLGACLADDMGLGKTIQVLAYLEQQRVSRLTLSQPPFRTLLLCPKSLVDYWKQEARECAPQLRVLTLDRSHFRRLEEGSPEQVWEAFDLAIVSYGLVQRYAEHLHPIIWDFIVLDEAQSMKNRFTQLAVAIKQFLRAHQRLALTGTPIENHLGELFSLLEFLNPGIALSELVSLSPKHPNLSFFLKGIRPLFLRRMKSQVMSELPEKTEQVRLIPLSSSQKELYEVLKKQVQEQWMKVHQRGQAQGRGVFSYASFFIENMLRLRQVACHPRLLGEKIDDFFKGISVPSSSKLDYLMNALKNLGEGHKAVVFSQFTSFLQFVRKGLEEAGIPYEYLDGQTQDRLVLVNRFQESPGIPILLASLKVGGLGLNLTAADYCFLLDPWWNQAAEKQAIDRLYRMGQSRPVFVYRLISEGTIEEKMQQLHQKKQDIADQLMTADQDFLEKLSAEDFEFLIR